VLEGDGKVRRGMLFPVIREGMIGRSRKADIRLRCNAVRNRHAYFEMTANGLLVRAAGSARIQGNAGRMRAMMLTDGSVITIGRLRLMLILTDVQQPVFCKHFEMIPVKTSILDPAGYSVFKEICLLSRCTVAHFVARRRIVPVVFHNKTDPKRLQIARDLKPERQTRTRLDRTLR